LAERLVKDQLHIRNAEAARLARTLARQTGKTVSKVVLEALRQYRPARPSSDRHGRLPRWRRLLRRDQKRGLLQPEQGIDMLYDEAFGLPK